MPKVLRFTFWLLRNEFEHRLARLASYYRPHVQSAASPMLAWTWRRCVICRHVSPFPSDVLFVNPFCGECGGLMRDIAASSNGMNTQLGPEAAALMWSLLIGTAITIVCVVIARYAERAR